MSASIRGGLSFASLTPASSTSSTSSSSASPASQTPRDPKDTFSAPKRKRRPTISGISHSSPEVVQLTQEEKASRRGEAPRDTRHYPPPPTPGLGPVVHSPFSPGGNGPSNTPLLPMTPIAAPSSAFSTSAPPSSSSSATSSTFSVSASASASQVGAPLAMTPSRLSIASSSSSIHSVHTHHTSGGVSRASSCRSTSSVQAVPMRKPQRGPRGGGAVGAAAGAAAGGAPPAGGRGGAGGRPLPKIVTRGINALGAYGVGVPSPTRGNSFVGAENGFSAATAGGMDGKGKARDDSPSGVGTSADDRPPIQSQRSSWRGRFGSSSASNSNSSATPLASHVHSTSNSGLPSPVGEEAHSNSSSPARASSPPLPGGIAGGVPPRFDSPNRQRGREMSASSGQRPSISGASDEGRRRESTSSSATRPSTSSRHQLTDSTSTATSYAPSPLSSPRLGGAHDASLIPPSPMRPSALRERERELSAGSAMTANSMGVVGNRRSTEDFEFGEVLGEGSYSTVTHVTTLHPPFREYALKVLDKEHIKREKKTKYVLIERDTLKALDGHPGVIKLFWTFQDEWSLYYVLELAQNGELLKWIKKYGSFDLRSARYYTAQVLSAVGYMHEKGVIHRDLKPENILIDETMRIKITDFGTAKLLQKEELVDGKPADDPQGRPRPRSFVGTPEYVSPEILSEGKESSFSSDFWALGCILFQLLAGRPPFQARTEYLMFQKIVKLEYEFPLGFPAVAKDLVEKLLVLDPTRRLGGNAKEGNGIEAIRSHPFFSARIDDEEREERWTAQKVGREGGDASTPESTSAPSSLGDGEVESTPASSVAWLSRPPTDEEELHQVTSRLSLGDKSLPSLPPAPTSSPLPPSSPDSHPLDGPIDFGTIWDVDPPEIRTGLVQPAPVIKGEFVLLDDDTGSSSVGTGLTGRASRYTSEAGGPDWAEGGERYEGRYGSDEDDEDDIDGTASSPTSASGRDLPLASKFGAGKWADILLPSETILMLSEVLQRPASSAAAARTAILRGPTKLKLPAFNPRNLMSSSPSNNSLLSTSNGPPSAASVLSASPSSSASASTSLSQQTSPPHLTSPNLSAQQHHAGSKPRTLILTDYPRLLCLKESPNKISVKNEVFLGSALRGGVRREGVSAFICVEPAGKEEGRGFVVKTSSRNYKYDEPSGQASRWIAELREAHRAGLVGPKPR